MKAVFFDFGYTLGFLDFEMLSRRVKEAGIDCAADALGAAYLKGQAASEARLKEKQPAELAWLALISTMLREASDRSVSDRTIEGVTAWLFSEQPRKNLWRRVPDAARALLDRLHGQVKLGIVSNSEGRLAELAGEVGIADRFEVIADSGVLGISKPDPRIFVHALEKLGVEAKDAIHVGDSFEADVVGARAAGLRAIWFHPNAERSADVFAAKSFEEIGAILDRLRTL